MNLIPAIALSLMTAVAQAAPFPGAGPPQAAPRVAVQYYLFITYFTQSGVTAAIELGPFQNEKACANAAQLVASKAAIGATACLKNQ